MGWPPSSTTGGLKRMGFTQPIEEIGLTVVMTTRIRRRLPARSPMDPARVAFGEPKQEEVMSRTAIVWTIVVVLIVLVLVWVAIRKGVEKKRDLRRREADDMRGRAATEERTVRTREAEAAEEEALARQARAESDRKAATAAQLELQADERGEQATAKRAEQHDRLRAADDLDPDVPNRGRPE